MCSTRRSNRDVDTRFVDSTRLAPPKPSLPSQSPEGFGPAAGELLRLWDDRSKTSCDGGEIGYYYRYYQDIFDSVLAIAIAIRSILAEGGSVTGLSIIEQWEDPNFSFNGASGNVRFGADESYRYYVYGAHDRVDLFDIESFADGVFEPIGSWDPLSEIEEEIVSLTVDP